MRFLVDANLPPALAEWLTAEGYEAQHVSKLGLADASDRTIWRYAQGFDACVVTKDEDFVLLQALDSAGPAVVWIRIGNAVRSALFRRLPAVWPDVIAALMRGDKVVEVR